MVQSSKKNKRWLGVFRVKPSLLVTDADMQGMTHEELVDLDRRDKKVAQVSKVAFGTSLVAAGVVGVKCAIEGEGVHPPGSLSLNPPPASVPADVETGRPDIDMANVKKAVDAARTGDAAMPDGTSGATKTGDKKHGSSTQRDAFMPVNIPVQAQPAKQETPAERAAREAAEKAYMEKINGGDDLIIKRDMADILLGKLAAEAVVDTKVPLEAPEFTRIPRDTAVEIMHRVHSQTEEAAWIAFKLGKPFGSVSKAEQQQYWSSLSEAEQIQLRNDMKNPPDEVGAMIGRNARMARQNAFNDWLANNGFQTANGAGIGR